MRLRCAIFDFDGTLFDSMFLWDSIGETYLHALGKEPKPNLREDVRALSLYQSACYLREEYDLPLSAEEIVDGINQTIEHFYRHDVLPKPGAAGFLEELGQAGVRMCIATASDRLHIEAALQRCGMAHWFEAIFTCAEIGHGKDEPLIFRKAMEHCGADRSNTIVLEDALHAIRTAKADGFAVAAIYDGSEKRQDEIRALGDCYLADFAHTEEFRRFAGI